MRRKGVSSACHFPSWRRGLHYSETSSRDMTLSLSQASTSQVKTEGSFTLPLLLFCVYINVCPLSSSAPRKSKAVSVRSDFLKSNGNLSQGIDLIFRPLCSQPGKTVSLLVMWWYVSPCSSSRDAELIPSVFHYVSFMFSLFMSARYTSHLSNMLVEWMIDQLLCLL